MTDEESFSVWISGAVLRASDEEIAALTLDALATETGATGDLAQGLAAMERFDRKAGDFGAEIIGPILIPVLIEAGKQLWASYVKKLVDKAAGQAADVTVEGIKAFVRGGWKSGSSMAEYEARLRAVAAAQGLATSQIENLIDAMHGPKMSNALAER